ncbi:MAG: SMP-30/gluconolactonase/LRE family protein [Chitinophagaceae bacterium]|nr:SMP-30/gluconolactonase/LRE family protein [Chitinophagaceae bacterium]
MKISLLFVTLFACTFSIAQNITYPVDPASVENKDVPKGEIISFTFSGSKIFPGTTREVHVYVPAQYKADKPACVYVNQDGIQWKAPTVFDNLIEDKEMPVTIGVFVTPGKVFSESNKDAEPRYNRSFEYDGLSDAYARFILTEIFPEVEKKKTKDGRAILLSKNGNDRAIGGSSSGAVCAFTAAWEKPGEFSRVFSTIGTYTGLRGADRYPILVRKYEPKPIRIFLQDGKNDLNIYGGDWFRANEAMESALTFAGYEVTHEWGEDGHNGNHGTAIFPKAMRWLWKDWPAPVKNGASRNQFLSDILIPGEDWQLVGEGYTFTEGTGGNEKGEFYFQDVPKSKTYKVDINGKLTELNYDAKKASGTSFGPDGKYYTAAGGSKQILAYDKNLKETVVADNISGNDLIVANNGNIYVTAPDGTKPGKLILVRPNGETKVVDEGLKFPNGVTLSPDQTQLYATESATHWVWVYSINADGSLSNKQRYGWLHAPDTEDNAWPDGLKCDTAGRVYVATRIGIQVLDQPGRVNAILPVPPSNSQTSNVYFGGPALDILYVTAGDKVFKRKLKTKGVHSFQKPVTPGKPRL